MTVLGKDKDNRVSYLTEGLENIRNIWVKRYLSWFLFIQSCRSWQTNVRAGMKQDSY